MLGSMRTSRVPYSRALIRDEKVHAAARYECRRLRLR